MAVAPDTINLWATPRSCSTALLYAFAQHPLVTEPVGLPCSLLCCCSKWSFAAGLLLPPTLLPAPPASILPWIRWTSRCMPRF